MRSQYDFKKLIWNFISEMMEWLLNQWRVKDHSIAQEGKGQPNGFLSFVEGKRGPQLALRGSSLGKRREKQEDSNEE